MRIPAAVVIVLLVGGTVSQGCARAAARGPESIGDADIVRLPTGEPVPFEQWLAEALEARVVYVGEQHDQARDHRVQAAVIAALHDADPSLAIGMEMFQHPFQPALDDYVAGRIDEAALRERTEWKKRWGFDYALYRPILELARRRGIRVVALNTPAEVTRQVAHHGLAGLEPGLRAALPPLDLDDPAHRAMVRDALAEHPHMDPAAMERFYQAQVVWDESMAAAIDRTLTGPDAPRRMVVLAGRMHVRRPAIPERAARRGAAPYTVVLPVSRDALADETREEARLADWLWAY